MNQFVMNANQRPYITGKIIMASSLENNQYNIIHPKEKTMKKLRLEIRALIAVFGLFFVIAACTNNNESTKSSATDSSNVSTPNDTAMNNAAAPDTTANKVSTPKPADKETASKATGTRKKGRATIGTMSETKANETAMKADKNGIYDMTEVRPAYPGGQTALSNYVNDRIEYPQMAIDDNKEGTVNVQFVVDENGKVSDAKVVGGKLGDGLDEEAERIISQMPKWTPGKVKGKAVKTRVTLPITYKLEE